MLEKISKDFVIDHRTRHVEGLRPEEAPRADVKASRALDIG